MAIYCPQGSGMLRQQYTLLYSVILCYTLLNQAINQQQYQQQKEKPQKKKVLSKYPHQPEPYQSGSYRDFVSDKGTYYLMIRPDSYKN